MEDDWLEVDDNENNKVNEANKPTHKYQQGRCKVCGRTLTLSKSVRLGIGPECIKKYPELANITTEEEAEAFLDAKREEETKQKEEEWEQLKQRVEKLNQPQEYWPGLSPDQAKARLSKFKDRDWRQYQKEAIEFAMRSNKKFRIIEAPTGAGKSLIAMVCGLMGKQANYLCGTKMLQKQIVDDFPEAKSLWGRANYICKKDRSRNCGQCIQTNRDPCKEVCEYKLEKTLTLQSKLRVLNFQYYLSEIQFAGKFSNTPLTIVDEADSLENTLVNHISLEFSERALYRLNLSAGPARKTATARDGLSSWVDFGNLALKRARDIIRDMSAEIESWETITTDYQHQKIKEFEYFVHLSEKCEMFVENVDQTWIMEETERRGSIGGKLTFRPLWVTPDLAHEFLWRHADNFILLSASFLPVPVLCKTLGIPEDEVDYMAIPSTFPVDNRPINLWPVANLSNKTMDDELPKLIKGIKTILNNHKGEKGIIHSVSFKLAKEIINQVRDPRLITHDSFTRQGVVNDFMNNSGDWVLVSPSIERGVDFKYDLCRFVICAKAPYLSLGDRVVSQRIYSSSIGKLWYSSSMMLSVLQACGRGMRAADDFCTCVTTDTKTLTRDLRWVPIGDLKVGDELFAFDEHNGEPIISKRPGWTLSPPRRWKFSRVEGIILKRKRVLRIIFKNGECIYCTPDHKWLIRGHGGRAKWIESRHLEKVLPKKGYDKYWSIIKTMPVWDTSRSIDAGWLAGIYDGEGSLALHAGQRNRFVPRITISQKQGIVLDEISRCLDLFGFEHKEFIIDRDKPVSSVTINGSMTEVFRFLGQIRPIRLLDKFMSSTANQSFRSCMSSGDIETIEDGGIKEIAVMQTSTGTFLANGYAAHNCYLLDENINRIYTSRPSLWPDWFKDGITWSDGSELFEKPETKSTNKLSNRNISLTAVDGADFF